MCSTNRKTPPRTVLVALLGLATLAGCEGARDLTYAQGRGENLYAIADYQGKTLLQNTGEKRFKGQTSRADELIVIDNFDKINNLDAVELRFEDGLLAGAELRDLIFYAREKHAYNFVYDFNDDYVIVSKIAPREDIPSQELTYAEKTGEEMYKVPVLGVPVTLYTVESIEDSRGKDTRRLNEYVKDYLKDATHFRMNLEGIKYFDAPGKQDLLPTDFFNPDDEWFYTKTLVGRPIDSQAILGQTLAALKIKLVRTNNSIMGVDLNIAEEQKVLDPTKTITALEFPVEWTDFRLERSGSFAMLKETKLGNQEPTSRFWKDRAYALVDFNNADRLDKAFTLDNKLEKLEIGEDYISFNIYESGTGNTYKYSLKKVNEVKTGQKFFADDAKLFHIFSQKRTVIGGQMFEQTPDIENIVFANRFFPGESKEIVYHLSDNSDNSPEFTEAVKAALEAWDKAFQEANTGINVRFDEKRVELGDVRYNQIVLYGYEIDSQMASGGMLLGFGPSVQDTRSGETYSAAVHIYLRAYREGLIRNIRSFIRNEIGLYDDKVVTQFDDGTTTFGGSPAGNATPRGRSDEFEGTVANLDFLTKHEHLTKKPARLAGIINKIEHGDEKREEISEFRKSFQTDAKHPTTNRCEHGNVAANTFSWQKIRDNCLQGDTKLSKYLAALKAAHQASPAVMNLDGESEAILECAQPLMKELLTSTLIHEIGHNLGMGHNFAASSDGPNYAKDGADIAYPSSSVMDYPDRDYDLYSKVGPYDIALIRYLYGRRIETSDGKDAPIPEGMSAIAAAQKAGKQVKPYRMCTDYEIGGSNLPAFDPLCMKWDVGENPVEYVRWAIRKIHADIIEGGYRYNDARFFGALSASSYFSHFRQIHDYWRYLMLKQAGLFFEKISSSDFNEFQLDLTMNNTRDPGLTKRYYQAVKEIFAFSRKVLRLPSRVCLLEDGGADPKVVDVFEFRNLRDKIFDKHNVTVQSCSQALPLAKDALAELGKSYDLTNMQFTDRGIEVDGLELDLDPAAASTKLKQYNFTTYRNGYLFVDANPLYSAGMFDLKISAMRTLFVRQDNVMAVTMGAQVRNISFVDIPWFRDALFGDAISTVTRGLSGADIDGRIEATKRFPHYREYEDTYWIWLSALLGSVGDTRSKAYYHLLSMIPMRETSQSTFKQTIEEEKDVWWVLIKNQYYLYEKDGSYVGDLLKLLAQIGQLGPVLTAKAKIDANAATEAAKIDLSGVVNDEQMWVACEEFLKTYNLTLQPPQEQALRKVLPAVGADAAELVTKVRAFLDEPIVTSPVLVDLVERQDFDNLSSLNAILTDFIESIY